MGCARSKRRSSDDIHSGEEMEGRASRYDSTRKSNESLIITVLWRRLSLFSRRGSTRRQSVSVGPASSMKSIPLAKPPEAGAAESPGPEQQQQKPPEDFTLPELEEEEENR